MTQPMKSSQRDVANGGPLARQDLFTPYEERDGLAILTDNSGSDPKDAPPKIPDITPKILAALGPLVEPNLRDAEGRLSLQALQAKEFKTYAAFEKFLSNQAAVGDQKSIRNPYEDLIKDNRFIPLLSLIFSKVNPSYDPSGDYRKAALMVWPEFQAELVEIDADAFARNYSQSPEGRAGIQKLLKHPSFLTKDQKSDLIKAIHSVADEADAMSSWERHTVTSNISPWNYFNLGVSQKNLDAATIGAEFMLDSLGGEEERAQQLRHEILNPSKSGKPMNKAKGSKRVSAEKVASIQEVYQEASAKTGAVAQARAQLAQLWLWAADDRVMASWKGKTFEQGRELQNHILDHTEALMGQAGQIKNREDLLSFIEDVQGFYEADLDLPADNSLILRAARTYQGDSLYDRMGDLPQAYRGPVAGLYELSKTWESSVKEMGQSIRLEEWEIKAQDPKLKKQIAAMIQGLEQTRHGLWLGYKQHKFISRAASNVASVANAGDIQDIEGAQITLNALMQQLSRVQEPEDLQAVYRDFIEELEEGGSLDRALKAAEMDGTEQTLGLGQTVCLMALGAWATRGISLVAEGTGVAARVAGLVQSGQASLAAAGRLGRMGQGAMMGTGIVLAENTLAVASGEARNGPERAKTWLKDITSTAIAMGLSAGLLKLPNLNATQQQGLAKALWARYTEGGLKGLGHLATDTGVEIIEELTDQYLRQRVLEGDSTPLSEAEITEITLMCFAMGPMKMGILAEHLKGLNNPSQNRGSTLPSSKSKSNSESKKIPIETEPANDNKRRTSAEGETLPWAAAAGLSVFLSPEITNAAFDVGSAIATQGIWGGVLAALGFGTLGMAVSRNRKKSKSISQAEKNTDPDSSTPQNKESPPSGSTHIRFGSETTDYSKVDKFYIGRNPGDQGIKIDDPLLRSAHTTIVRKQDGSYHIRNRDPKRETFLTRKDNTQRVSSEEALLLEQGDVVTVGKIHLRFNLQEGGIPFELLTDKGLTPQFPPPLRGVEDLPFPIRISAELDGYWLNNPGLGFAMIDGENGQRIVIANRGALLYEGDIISIDDKEWKVHLGPTGLSLDGHSTTKEEGSDLNPHDYPHTRQKDLENFSAEFQHLLRHPIEAVDFIIDQPRDRVVALLKAFQQSGRLVDLSLRLEQRFLPGVNSTNMEQAMTEARNFERNFLKAYRDPIQVNRDKKISYLLDFFKKTEDPVMQMMRKDGYLSWEVEGLEVPPAENPVELGFPIHIRKLLARGRKKSEVLNYLFGIVQISSFLNKKRGHYGVDTVSMVNLLLTGEGLCENRSILFSHLASLVDLEVYAGHYPGHAFIYAGHGAGVIETTQDYMLLSDKKYQDKTEVPHVLYSPGFTILSRINNLAVEAIHHHDYETALHLSSLFLKLEPRDSGQHFLKGFAQAQLGKYSQALASYRRSLEIAPSKPKVLEELQSLIKKLEAEGFEKELKEAQHLFTKYS